MFDIFEFTPKALALISVYISLIPFIGLLISSQSKQDSSMTLFGSLMMFTLPLSLIGLVVSLIWATVKWILGFL